MTRPSRYHHAQSGFSLVEMLCVLAIMSLMVGAVVMTLPKKTDAVTAQAAKLSAQINHAAQDGLIRNQLISVALSTDGYAVVPYDKSADAPLTPWADTAVIALRRDGVDIPVPKGRAVPLLLFEPTGGSSVFELILRSDNSRHIIRSTGDGRVSMERQG